MICLESLRFPVTCITSQATEEMATIAMCTMHTVDHIAGCSNEYCARRGVGQTAYHTVSMGKSAQYECTILAALRTGLHVYLLCDVVAVTQANVTHNINAAMPNDLVGPAKAYAQSHTSG